MPRLALVGEQQAEVLTEEPYLNEGTLQDLLERQPELISLDEVDPSASPLLPIGREVLLAGQSLDLLFIDADGKLTAIETKLRRNPEIRRQVVGQVLEYGAYLSAWTVEDVERQAERYLNDQKTPARFRGQSLYSALAALRTDVGDGSTGGDLRSRVADSLDRTDLRLIIAVDTIVDPLRVLVTFTNGNSRFSMYLLEVQQYIAPSGLRIASINVFGGATHKKDGGAVSTRWDEPRFLQALEEQAPAESATVVRDLYSFVQEEADSVAWGVGASKGSAGFAVRRGSDRIALFSVWTDGGVAISTSVVMRRGVLPEAIANLLDKLRGVGVNILLHGEPGPNGWASFDAKDLASGRAMDVFKVAMLEIRDLLRGVD